jgi:hypothetical protein
MKIARSPYQAKVTPRKDRKDALWFCVISREGSSDVVARLEAPTKEDASAAALLELARLHGDGPLRGNSPRF